MARTPKTATVVDTGTDEVAALKDQVLGMKKQVGGLEDKIGTFTSCECSSDISAEQFESVEQKVDVLLTYVKTFNNFLNNSMISNNADKAAEDALTDVLSELPTN